VRLRLCGGLGVGVLWQIAAFATTLRSETKVRCRELTRATRKIMVVAE